MNVIERVARRIDRTQQHHRPAAFVFGVIKKYGDDRAGSLAALVTYYGFLSLFPLLLVLVTVLGIVVGGNSSFTKSVEHSVLAQFPVIGTTIGKQITALHRNSTISLVIGILFLVYGSMGAMQAGQLAMAQVWNVPGVVRPNYWVRLVRALLMILVLGLFLLLSTGAATFVSFGTRTGLVRAGTVVATLLLNIVLYVLAFRILTPKQVGHRGLLPGAVLGGVAWTILQYAGSLLVTHQLRNTQPVYGFFAVVLGMITWLYLGAQVTMYAAELNVVRERRLWPRSMVQPPLTEADERVLAAISKQEERRPEQEVIVRFRRPDDGEGDGATAEPAEGTAPTATSDPAPAPGSRTTDGGAPFTR